MNPTPPQIFDRALLARRRLRMREEGAFLYREAAARVVERLDIVRKDLPLILDTGHGDGFLQDELRKRKGTQTVLSADLAPRPGVDLVMDAEWLPFAPRSLDAVVSCLDLHWVNDLPGALVQISRALKPDGLFLSVLLGGETLHELRAALMEAELRVTGGASPRVSPFLDLRDMGALMQRAGFALPVVDAERVTADYPDMFALMKDLRAMGSAYPGANRLKKPTRRAVFFEAARIYREKYGDAGGRIPATFDFIHAIGWAPHESQQKPLMPGSAKARLSEALQTDEIKLSF